MKRRAVATTLALAAVLAGLGLSQPPSTARAQATDWSPPKLIFEGPGATNYPALLADEFGQVHAWWAYSPPDSGRTLIYYTRLDQPNWEPIDVFAVQANVSTLRATRSATGMVAMWSGRFIGFAGFSPEGSAQAWAGPYRHEPAYPNGGVATAPDGAVWLIYGSTESNSVFVQRLDPVTGLWGSQLLVANRTNSQAAPDTLRLAISPEGVMHAVWVEYQLPTAWPPLGVYYARSTDEGNTWSTPRRLADTLHNQPNVLAGPDGRVYIAWVGAAGVGGKYIQQSTDEGLTWGPVEALTPRGDGAGSQGAPELALDSNGTLHVVFTAVDCIYHTSQQETGWAPLDCFSTNFSGAVKEYPAMTISQGNRLHVLFWTDRRQLWHMTRTLDAPAIEPLPLPTAVPPTPTPIPPTPTVEPTRTPLPDFGPAPTVEMTNDTGMTAIAAGAAPVVVLFVAMVAGRLWRRRR